jgi:hypothetical protein
MPCYVSFPHEITMLAARFCAAPFDCAQGRLYGARIHFGRLPTLPASRALAFSVGSIISRLPALGASIHQHRVDTLSVSRRRPKMFSRELPDAAWHGNNLSGSFHSPSLVPCSGSVRMTGVSGLGSSWHFERVQPALWRLMDQDLQFPGRHGRHRMCRTLRLRSGQALRRSDSFCSLPTLSASRAFAFSMG